MGQGPKHLCELMKKENQIFYCLKETQHDGFLPLHKFHKENMKYCIYEIAMEIIFLDNQKRDVPIVYAIAIFPFCFYLVCVHSQDKPMLLYGFVVRHFLDNTVLHSLYHYQSSPWNGWSKKDNGLDKTRQHKNVIWLIC